MGVGNHPHFTRRVTMASAVDIVNGALTKIGVSPINSLDDEGQVTLIVNARFYDVLDALIQDYPWNFAVRRQELARSPDAPESRYRYKYALPSDCLQVMEEANDYTFVVEEEKFLLSDADSINLVYLKKIDDMSELPAYFREVFSYRLASEVCYSLTGDLDVLDRITNMAERVHRAAKVRDAQEGTPKGPKAGTWVTKRR
jgi:hypothetical protein